MAAYTPYLIAPLKTAKSISMEPWLSPIDAFPVLQNVGVNKGVWEKRNGFSEFAQMLHGLTPATDPIMGVHTYLKNGMPHLLIMDTKRVNRYDPSPAASTMTDISGGSDIFTGLSKDYFHFANWLNYGYMTNNRNQVHRWSGIGDVEPFNYQFQSGDSKPNHLDTCRYIFQKDDRLLFLDTVELGQWYPGRCRYTPVLQTDGLQPGASYVDAPTEGRIMGAAKIGKNIGVWFPNSFWEIRSSGNSDVPLVWKKITSTEGCRTPYGVTAFNDGIAAVGYRTIHFYDGYKVKDMNVRNLRDIVDDFDTGNIHYTFGQYSPESRHLLLSYAADGSPYPDRLLDYNIIEDNWSVHTSAQTFWPHCLGSYTGQKVPMWTDADLVYTGADGATMDEMTVDSREQLGDTYPFTLIGCRNGKVYKWDDGNYDGTDDANGNIAMEARSARWNPFTKAGRMAKLQKIDILVDNDNTATMALRLFTDCGDIDTDTEYKAETLSCAGTSNKDKTWVTLWADGEVGNFHQLRISHDARTNRPRIHAMILYMKPAGHLSL